MEVFRKRLEGSEEGYQIDLHALLCGNCTLRYRHGGKAEQIEKEIVINSGKTLALNLLFLGGGGSNFC